MSSSTSVPSRRRFHLPTIPSDLTVEGIRLFLDSLERRQQHSPHPMLASFLKTLRGYSTHDVDQAERSADDFLTQLHAREERKAMHAVSTTLSSLNRPHHPVSQSAADELWLFRLPVDTLHYLLSFIANEEFFLRLPFLSHSLQHLYTQPDLHRQYGQQRFDLSGAQWRAYSSQAWPQLTVPVWRYGYYEADAEMKQAVERVEALERRQQKRLQRRYIRSHGKPYNNNNNTNNNSKRATAASLDNMSRLMAHRRDEEKEQKEVASRQRKEAKKDWALEATHLYQHLHFATLDMLRFAPQLTSTGLRLHYRLPRYIVASILDSLTTCRMDPLFALERRCRAEGKVNTHRLFLPRYEAFSIRSTREAAVGVQLPPRVMVSVGVGLDESEVASMREALPTDVSEVAGDEVKAEVEEWQITEVTQQWLDELEMEEEEEEEQGEEEVDEEGEDLRQLQRRYRGLPSRLPHLLPLVFGTDQYDNPIMLDCIFFSPLLQQTLKTAAAAASASPNSTTDSSPSSSSASSSSSLLVDLSQCPIARFELCDDGWGPDRISFVSTDAWAAAGGMDWMCREPAVVDYKYKKRMRDRRDWLGWTEADDGSAEHKGPGMWEEEEEGKEGKEGKEEKGEVKEAKEVERKVQKGLDSRKRRMEERKMYEYEEEEEEEEEEVEDDAEEESEDEEDEDDEDEEDGADEDEGDDDEDGYEDIPVPTTLRAGHAAFMSYLLRNTDQPSQWVFEHADWETSNGEAAKQAKEESKEGKGEVARSL